MSSFKRFVLVGMAVDPIHIGTGGARIGRVDLTIAREPATRLPKIPGSSLAGVYRTYVAMAETEENQNRQVKGQSWPYYPHCAGLGQARDGYLGHCAQPDCPVCTVFGFARGKDQAGGFAGLAAFSDAQILLFPVPTRRGPYWVTSPMAVRGLGLKIACAQGNVVYLQEEVGSPLNLGWLYLESRDCKELFTPQSTLRDELKKLKNVPIPDYVLERLALVADSLFPHVVNSNLEVRTSVSINPETGAAEEGALFSYEALPRGTVLVWEVITKNPKHFKVSGSDVDVKVNNNPMNTPERVFEVVQKAHPYLEALGIGGMNNRGMGRLRVLGCLDGLDLDPNATPEKEEAQAPGSGG